MNIGGHMARHIEGLYEITKEFEKDNNAEECYHRLANLCDSIMNIDEFKFDLDQFSIEEKKYFINKFIEILESNTPFVENVYKAQKEKKNPNKKLCYTLRKEDVDNSLDYLMKFFLECGYKKYNRNAFVPNLEISRYQLIKATAEERKNYRYIIRHTNDTEKEKFEKCYSSYMDNFGNGISQLVENRNHRMYNLLEALYFLYKEINLFADIYFQSIIYLLIENRNLTRKDKLEKLSKLVKYAEKTEREFEPRTDKAEEHNICDSFAVYLMYLNYRNICKSEIYIQRLLVRQMEDETYSKVVKDEYQCNQRWICDIETSKELRTIILEGKDEKEERFNKNIEDVQQLILLVKNGQSLHQIYIEYVDEIMCSEKTLYNYVDAQLFDIRNIDLPRKVKYRPRYKQPEFKVDRGCRIGRSYTDFQKFLETKPESAVVQMDSVIGRVGGKCLLTIHFVETSLMLAFLRDSNTSASVIQIINLLDKVLGNKNFSQLFPVILTDNGSEFSNPKAIEKRDTIPCSRTNVFYCDPSAPYQKGACEVNHELIRRILPKGSSFDDLTQKDIFLMMDHINSYKRKKLNNRSPYETFSFYYGEDILKKLGCKPVAAENIILKPKLLKK